MREGRGALSLCQRGGKGGFRTVVKKTKAKKKGPLLILTSLCGPSVSTVKEFRTLFSLLYRYLLSDYKNSGFVRIN
jgi:hypothetical protein